MAFSMVIYEGGAAVTQARSLWRIEVCVLETSTYQIKFMVKYLADSS